MISTYQLDRLKSQLMTSGLQQKDNALFQVINQLIDAARQIQIATNTKVTESNNSDGGSVVIAPTIFIPGSDGIDGLDSIIPGPQGLIGPSGSSIQGTQGFGVPGYDGNDGYDGHPGPQGVQGPAGSSPNAMVRAGQRVAAWNLVDGSANRDVGTVLSVSGSFAQQADSGGFYRRGTSAASTGAQISFQNSSINSAWFDYNPLVQFYIRTGSNLANLRLWFGLWSTAPTNADDMGGTTKYCAFRYSTVAGDGGWVGVTRDGTTQNVSASIVGIATSTAYLLTISVTGGGTSVLFTVDTYSSPGVVASSFSTTMAIGAGSLGVGLQIQGTMWTTENVAKILDYGRFYYEHD